MTDVRWFSATPLRSTRARIKGLRPPKPATQVWPLRGISNNTSLTSNTSVMVSALTVDV